ncbi:MAG TPA: arginine deiminase family protein [Terriglobia bacterium]|nr:arginine deiminase family protein [Terriglobia bacterium]
MSTSPYSFTSACPATDAYYSVNSEYGRLRAVLLRRPAEEIEDIEDPPAVLFQDFVNPELARRQHDGLAERLNSAGVEVHYIQGVHKTVPNLYFTRDTVVTTLSGAVLCRPSTAERRGESQIVRQSIANLPLPIVLDVWGPGTLEGGDVCIVSPHLALIGQSQRTNNAGAGQLSVLLQAEGFDCNDIYVVPLNPDTLHLDMILGVIDRDLVVVSERFSPPMLLKLLAEYGIRAIPLPEEEAGGMALNLLCLEPGHVLLPAGNPFSRRILEKAGVTCTEIEISELQKGGGGLHCMTAVLKRDLVA